MATNDDFFSDVMDKWDYVTDAEQHNRDRMLSDLRFANGDQWPDHIRRIRESEAGGRPCLTINKYPAFERQVINDIRQMRPAIKIRPGETQTTPETANVMNGIIKSIEMACSAETAYDWAAMYACRIGRGFWKIVNDYTDDYSFEQKISIERIRNPFNISLDPDHKEHDASDMRWAFEVFRMSKREYEMRWPDAQTNWPGETKRKRKKTSPRSKSSTRGWTEWPNDQVGQTQERWFDDDSIRIAQYYEVVENEQYISMLIDPMTGQQMIIEGNQEGAIQTRKVKHRRIKLYTMTPVEILDEYELPGKYIPIVPVSGEEVDIEGRVYYKGMVRDMRDSQVEINLMRSTSVEQIALQPKSPWVGPKGSFKNPKWNNANRNNYSYLEYEIVQPGYKPERQQPMTIEPALQEEIRIATEELKEISGIYQAGLGAQGNEVAGVAINGRKLESEISNFHYMDNLSRAMRQSGKILVNMIPEVMSGVRQVEITKEDGTTEAVTINQPYIDEQGKEHYYPIESSAFDVTVDTGPSYTTQRQEAADQIMDLLDKYPESRNLLGDLLVQNLDWPNGMAEEAAKRIKAMLPPEVLQGESPAISNMIQQMQAQSEAEKQQLMQLNQMLQGQIEQLAKALQDKQVEQQLKAQDQERKTIEGQQKYEIERGKLQQQTIEGQQDHAVDVSKLELEHQRNLTGGLTQ